MSWWGRNSGASVYSSSRVTSSKRRRPKGGVDLGLDVVVKLRLYERAHLRGRGESALVQYLLQHPKIEGMQVSFTCRREQLNDALKAIAENQDDLLNSEGFQFESLEEMLQAVMEKNLGVSLGDDSGKVLTGDSTPERPGKEDHRKSLDPWSNIKVKGED